MNHKKSGISRTKLFNVFAAVILLFAILGSCSPSGTASGRNASGSARGNTSKQAVSGSRDPAAGTDTDTVTIAASFYPIYIMVLNVAKDIPDVRVIDMTKPTTGCLHDYAVTPDDMKNLEGSQFLVINGAGMESFMGKVINQFPDIKIIDSSKGVKLIKGYGDEGDNPHIWVSISDAIKQVQNIGGELSSLDTKHAAAYRANTDTYVQKLKALSDKMHKALDNVKKRNIITFHEAFPYFAQEFNLNIAAVIEREPGSEPSAKELDETIATVEKLNIKALFTEPQYSAKAAETIARETGAKVYTLDPAVTGPMDPDAYLDIMNKNLKVLEEALN